MEKAFIVGVNFNDGADFQMTMKELENLAEACDMEVIGRAEQRLAIANTATYIGPGKVTEVKEAAHMLGADIVIFDNGLSPIQLRNLQRDLEMAVMDRTTLILEIFALRAKTKEAKLQVEVARLQYMLPRLVGLHEALSRQGGGSGAMSNKGAGEKKIELDRRRLEKRLAVMRRELQEIQEERNTQRKKRAQSGIPRVALVGYTNAGKSTLMNRMLTEWQNAEEKKVFEKDMLFATLDTTVRRIAPPEYTPFLLSDTVGFISHLPHHLVKAFRSTLEEVEQADLLLQVIDYADPNYQEYIKVTNDTLRELGAEKIPMIYVFNKADVATLESIPCVRGEDKIYMSAKSGQGLCELLDLMKQKLAGGFVDCQMLIPYKRGDIVSYFNANAVVKTTEYLAEGVKLTLHISQSDYGRYQEYCL